MVARVKQIFTYPIKGLTPQTHDRARLERDWGIPGDRAFALMFVDPGKATPEMTVEWLSKGHFAMQNDWPGLAALNCRHDREILTVSIEGNPLLAASLEDEGDRDRIGQFFTGYLAGLTPTPEARHPQKSPLKLVGNSKGKTRYPDRHPVHISILSQATLDALSEACGKSVDVRRFRPNILIDGVEAWEEFNWVGKTWQLGEAKIEIAARIGRCPNIEVDPETGDRDLGLLSLLKDRYGHCQTGVLAKVLTSGDLAVGDRLEAL
ncbi:MOSC domain-containing protein [Oxynema sp. CENA135]|nr:MOSC domain-containing protein [Oxynema sp. CENA135]